jgi:hypothetical protein
MKNILLTGQLIWDALQADSGDFDVLWEVLQSQKVQGYITQADLDTLYRQIAQEQDTSIAFGLIHQLQRVLAIYSPNRSQAIDIEVNHNVYSHSVAVELAEAPVLSLHGFLERYALDMLYSNDTLADGSDADVSVGMQQWYRKWRQSGFDMLWLFPVIVTLALQSMPFFQKMVADLFEVLDGKQTPQPPQVAQKSRPSALSQDQPIAERSPSIPFPRLPNGTPSPKPPSQPNAANDSLNSFGFGDSHRSSENTEPTATQTPSNGSQIELLPSLAPGSQPLPTAAQPTQTEAIVQNRPIAPPVTPQSPQNPETPTPTTDGKKPPKPQSIGDAPREPSPAIDPPPTAPPVEDSGTLIPNPAQPHNHPTDPQPLPPSTPLESPQLGIAGDGVMNIPDPLIDPSSIADPFVPSQPQNPLQPGLPHSDSQSNLPNIPDDWSGYELEYGQLEYGQSNNLTIAPESEVQQSGGIGIIPIDNALMEPPLIGLGTDSLNFRF